MIEPSDFETYLANLVRFERFSVSKNGREIAVVAEMVYVGGENCGECSMQKYLAFNAASSGVKLCSVIQFHQRPGDSTIPKQAVFFGHYRTT